ncbi:MAG: hypothetical protein Q8K78_17010 [Planctomycetaceae bacterium]|nr:hypothetical protein [Planctomycetaceae bacterium]
MKRPEHKVTQGLPQISAAWWWVAAVVLTWLFWGTLWTSGGLVGGDVYSYSLPQKTFLADSLHAGVIPFWNSLTGQGYPVLGESQTGALYPLHLLVYGLCDVATGWNIVLVVHYIAAFVAMAWCARTLGVMGPGSLLAAIIYVYGWFPPRAFLDWAILGGVYLPLVIGAIEWFLQTGRWRFAVLMSLSLGMQLLGGHYQIAFLTWLLSGAFVIFRLGQKSLSASSSVPLAPPVSSSTTTSSNNQQKHWQSQWHTVIVLVGAFLLGVALAAPQLAASWELKGRSQRATIGVDHDPAYGHIPPGYLTQIVVPWYWYDPQLNLDAALQRMPLGQIASDTNRVEAHCYFGLLPVLLLIARGVIAVRRRAVSSNEVFWIVVIVASLAYATGWLMPVLQGLPGFNYFRGPGRASLLATFAVAILAGRLLDAITSKLSSMHHRRGFVAVMLIGTTYDLWSTPAVVSYAVAVTHPPIAYREESPLRKLLLAEPGLVRLYAPGANLPNVLGVASTPVYLGFGPREYFDPQLTMPETDPPDFHAFTPARLQWLLDAGVTHILSFEPLERRGWPVEMMWSGLDPMLNRAWARPEPLYLYRLKNAPGRCRWESGGAGSIAVKHYGPHRVVVQAEATAAGQLVLTDLADPNWFVTIDGTFVPTNTTGIDRRVTVPVGSHEVIWSYRPHIVYWGFAVSGIAAALLLLIPVWQRRRII